MNKIKILREELGLTVRELAKNSEVAIGYISTLENDKDNTTNPSKCVMTKIAKALNSTVVEVFFSVT
ncbi:helix-turn-helix transcriptional regulator [Clostridium saccharoperbutylacetonicum]